MVSLSPFAGIKPEAHSLGFALLRWTGDDPVEELPKYMTPGNETCDFCSLKDQLIHDASRFS
jgi:hypothetical protein